MFITQGLGMFQNTFSGGNVTFVTHNSKSESSTQGNSRGK